MSSRGRFRVQLLLPLVWGDVSTTDGVGSVASGTVTSSMVHLMSNMIAMLESMNNSFGMNLVRCAL